MTPLQQLTEKIYIKLPELKQLGVGCEIQSDDETFIIDDKLVKVMNHGQIQYYDIDIDLEMFPKFLLADEYDIIGKPPTLVDVRNWILTQPHHKYLTLMKVIADWNNSIYLRDQDEVLINFLNDLDNGL